jgi:hypothetical protein
MRALVVLMVACLLAAGVVFGSLMWLDQGFNKTFWDWVTGLRGDAKQTYGGLTTQVGPDEWTVARKAARQLAGKCEELAKDKSADAGTLLGVAFIYKYFPNRGCSYDAAVDRALAAAPDNRVVLAMNREAEVTVWLAKLKYGIGALDKMFAGQRASGTGRMTLSPTNEPFYSMVKPDDPFVRAEKIPAAAGNKERYAIKDPVAARMTLLARMQGDLPELLARVDAASTKDPDNAFYDYLKARVFFETMQRDKALECLKTALGKKVVQNYVDDGRTEAIKIMKSQRYPKVCRDYIAAAGQPAGQYVATHICKSGLDEMMRERRIRGNLTGAREIGALAAQIQKQCGIESKPDEKNTSE